MGAAIFFFILSKLDYINHRSCDWRANSLRFLNFQRELMNISVSALGNEKIKKFDGKWLKLGLILHTFDLLLL